MFEAEKLEKASVLLLAVPYLGLAVAEDFPFFYSAVPVHTDDLADEINRLRERKRDLLTKQAQDMGKVRIKKQAVEFLENQTTELTEYNDQLVRTLIEKITVRPDLSLTVEFKSGIIVEV